MGFHKDIAGQRFGRFEVIGDTGKRDKNDGCKILIARNIETGELVENSSKHFKSGEFTGYIGSEKHKKESGKRIKLSRVNLTNEEEKLRTIKSKITYYKKTKGYYFDKDKNKFVVRIQINGKTKRIGTFKTEKQAIEARQKAVNEQIKKLENEMERI
ncbi:hypothetical protein [Staphylococcus equorum]|uniref:hypothetical protein n=1 Tax=Staphylococcus equorum TaxID=246432 RepID=UPI0025538AC4|nr:hypothetical protein [Staphylococcus equorum]MDK9870074.1 hypothetical protein [Staphylococcus equorum]